ncbi:MAG: hypothetical protein E6H47_15220 [Betaproteobacteria bacterium]|nr:MAG: hypothetical protein E6H47_15220 [Betaproteobacteria bacterium]
MFTLAMRGVDLRCAARVATLAVCYLAAARLSLVLAIPPGYASAVRIVQEALDSVAAHAHARTVRMLLDVAEGKTLLSIRDDGIGFAAAADGEKRHAKGALVRMRETAEAARGRLHVESRPRYDTAIAVQVPA